MAYFPCGLSGVGEVGREMAWLVGRRVDMSEQAEQELVKAVGEKD